MKDCFDLRRTRMSTWAWVSVERRCARPSKFCKCRTWEIPRISQSPISTGKVFWEQERLQEAPVAADVLSTGKNEFHSGQTQASYLSSTSAGMAHWVSSRFFKPPKSVRTAAKQEEEREREKFSSSWFVQGWLRPEKRNARWDPNLDLVVIFESTAEVLCRWADE